MQKILSLQQLQDWDQYTREHDALDSLTLIEQAAASFFKALKERLGNINATHIFCGPGNNGADGLAIAKLLRAKGYQATAYYFPEENASSAFKAKEIEFLKENAPFLIKLSPNNPFEKLNIKEHELIIDALFGIGINKPITTHYALLIEHLNKLPNFKVAVDIPSGLHPDNINMSVVKFHSDYTITFSAPKLSFLLPKNRDVIKDFTVVDIGLNRSFQDSLQISDYYIEARDISLILAKYPKNKFMHKGENGIGLLLAGSKGRFGAMLLACAGALKCGIGKLICHLPQSAGNLVNLKHPEALVSFDDHPDLITALPELEGVDALAMGPAISLFESSHRVVEDVLKTNNLPTVIDADALNILGLEPKLQELLNSHHLLTPHCRELQRLLHSLEDCLHNEARQFCQQHQCFMVLKGAHSLIISSDGTRYFNSTGTAGMAKAGMGDLLTGMLLGFLAQGFSMTDAALCAVYVHGLAGELASVRFGIISMQTSDVIEMIPLALANLV